QFKLKSTTEGVKILSVGLKNVETQANFNSQIRSWGNYTNSIKELKTYDIPQEEQPLTNEFRLLSDYYIVLPQETENVESKPTFTIALDDNGKRINFEFSPATNWEMFNSYTYNLTYATEKIEVSITPEPWTENNVEEDIVANQYLNVSTRKMDLAQSEHLYYNSSFPSTTVADSASYPEGTKFLLKDYYNVSYEGSKIKLSSNDNDFDAESFTIYLQGMDLHGHVSVRVPIEVKAVSEDIGVDIDGTFWAPGNIIAQNGKLDIAPNASYTGLYFRFGSLIGMGGNNSGTFDFLPNKSIGFRPPEFNGTITTYERIPYVSTLNTTIGIEDAFIGRHNNGSGFDAEKAIGDPCRYMSNQAGWKKGKWRLPTEKEYMAIVRTRKIRRIN
ncbi:MAG: fimbrillin family protein, partial [Bacteroidales bacterium]